MRVNYQKEVDNFIETIFQTRQQISFREYQEINIQQSSEMLFAVMGLFHRNIACCKTIFRMKQKCDQTVQQQNPGSPQDRRRSPVASPRIIGVMT